VSAPDASNMDITSANEMSRLNMILNLHMGFATQMPNLGWVSPE